MNAQVVFDFIASQSLLLIGLVLLTYHLIRNAHLPVLAIIALCVLLAPIHGWVSTWIMFVGQYNRAFVSGQGVIAAVALCFVVVAVAEASGGRPIDSGEPSESG